MVSKVLHYQDYASYPTLFMPLCILLPTLQLCVLRSQFFDPAKHISSSRSLHLLSLLLQMSSISLQAGPFSSFRSELKSHLFSKVKNRSLVILQYIHISPLDSSRVYNILFLCGGLILQNIHSVGAVYLTVLFSTAVFHAKYGAIYLIL